MKIMPYWPVHLYVSLLLRMNHFDLDILVFEGNFYFFSLKNIFFNFSASFHDQMLRVLFLKR